MYSEGISAVLSADGVIVFVGAWVPECMSGRDAKHSGQSPLQFRLAYTMRHFYHQRQLRSGHSNVILNYRIS